MRKIIYTLLALTTLFSTTACNDYETYGELKEKEREKEKKAKSSKKGGVGRTILGTMIAAAATSFARSAGTRIAKNIGGSSTKKSSTSKSSTSKSSTAKKTTTKKSSTSLGSAAKKATKSAVNTATRKVTTEILKSIFK